MTDRVSLLVVTRNRPEFTIRMLRYYHHVGFRGRVLVGDSSTPVQAEPTRHAVHEMAEGLSVQYREFPEELSVGEITRQLLDYVTTPYVAFLGDDDYLIPSGVRACVAFLDQHSAYHAANGRALTFALRQEGAYGDFSWISSYVQRAVEAATAAQRLLDYLDQYFLVLFSVHRTAVFRRMYHDVAKVADRLFANEMIPCCLSVVQGKIKHLDRLFLLRQCHPRRTVHVADAFDWATSQSFVAAYPVFCESVAEAIAAEDHSSLVEARDLVKRAFWGYLAKQLNLQWQAHYHQPREARLAILRHHARQIPSLVTAWRFVRRKLSTQPSLEALLESSSVDFHDFHPIYQLITQRNANHPLVSTGIHIKESHGVVAAFFQG